MSPRLFPVAMASLAIMAISLTSCDLRSSGRAAQADLQAENDRLSSENADLHGQIANKDKRIEELGASGGSVGDQAQSIAGGPIEGFEPTARGGIALPEDFAFSKGSDGLNAEGEKAVARLAQRLNDPANAEGSVIIEGHTDHSPVARAVTKEKFTDNWGLSAARAASVVRALEKSGINAKRLHGAFRGEHSPRVAISDKSKENGGAGEAANRRVEIYLSKK